MAPSTQSAKHTTSGEMSAWREGASAPFAYPCSAQTLNWDRCYARSRKPAALPLQTGDLVRLTSSAGVSAN